MGRKNRLQSGNRQSRFGGGGVWVLHGGQEEKHWRQCSVFAARRHWPQFWLSCAEHDLRWLRSHALILCSSRSQWSIVKHTCAHMNQPPFPLVLSGEEGRDVSSHCMQSLGSAPHSLSLDEWIHGKKSGFRICLFSLSALQTSSVEFSHRKLLCKLYNDKRKH